MRKGKINIMKKLMSLLKAAMSQDMNIFKVKSKGKSKISKIFSGLILAGLIMFCIGANAQIFAELLAPNGLTYVVLSLFIILTTLLTIVEGAYKSQGILFESKDNDLLFSLPITKRQILFTRIFKLTSFQFLFNALFMTPALIVYISYEKPNIIFYIISIIMLFLLPIIPTIIGSFIGYVIKGISSRFKAKKAIQVVLTSLMLLAVFGVSFTKQNMAEDLALNAESINGLITKIYYPAGLYIKLIHNFNVFDLIIFFAVNIIPAIVFIYLASIYYFKITSKSTEKSISKKGNLKGNIYAVKSKLHALISKEIKRFLSSPVFIINTSFGLLLIIVATIGLIINFNAFADSLIGGLEINISIEQIQRYLPRIYFCIIAFMSLMTSITSSMISLEGKSLNITKSLPIESKKIILAKVLTSNIIAIPIIVLCDIIFFIAFKVNIIDILFIGIASVVIPTFSALLGITINLKHPKLDASSDTEVVKQSSSSFIAVLSGTFLGMITVGITVVSGMTNQAILIELLIFIVADFILWQWIKSSGVKRFNELYI